MAALLQSILTGESSSAEKVLEATVDAKAVYQDKTCILFSVSFMPQMYQQYSPTTYPLI